MWHVYNLVRAGDRVTAVTFRKIAVYGAGGGESERVKIKLTIAVEAVDFDPEGQLSSKTHQQAHADMRRCSYDFNTCSKLRACSLPSPLQDWSCPVPSHT